MKGEKDIKTDKKRDRQIKRKRERERESATFKYKLVLLPEHCMVQYQTVSQEQISRNKTQVFIQFSQDKSHNVTIVNNLFPFT